VDTPDDQVNSELASLRRRVAELEGAELKQREAQEMLRESEARLQAAIESLPFDFFALDTDGRYILYNSVLREHWGEDILGKRPEDLAVTEENLRLWLDNNRRALAGETVRDEVEMELKGERRHFYNVIAPIRVDGEITGILGINVDITERKRAEEALREAHDALEIKVAKRTAALESANQKLRLEIEERLQVEKALRENQESIRAFMDASSESMALVDTDGTILDINESGARRMGARPQDLIGKNGFKMVDAKVVEGRMKSFEEVIATGEPARVQDERTGISLDAAMYPIKDAQGKVYRVAIFAQDITERVKAERALRESEEQFRLVTEHSPIGKAIVQNMRMMFCNQGAADMFERRVEELQGLTLDEIAGFVHLADRDRVLEQARRRAEGDETVKTRYRIRIAPTKGKTKWLEILARPTTFKGRYATLASVIEITEQVDAEKALNDLNKKLHEEQELLDKKNIALRQMMTAVQEEKDKMKGHVQRNVSRLIMPLLDDLERGTSPRLQNTLKLLRASLTEITEPFVRDLEKRFVDLTPREADICRMIRNGMQTKEISGVLHISEKTVEKFRHSIRRKLKLDRKINLRTHLQSLE
jgi:PAS domain S-box-containing protein